MKHGVHTEYVPLPRSPRKIISLHAAQPNARIQVRYQ